MSETPETDAAELIYDGMASGYADANVCRKLERERDKAQAMLREERNILARAKAAVTEGVEQQNLPAGVSRKGCHERPEPSPHFIDTPKTYESDTPETCEAVERWQQGKINIFDEMARLERERDEARHLLERKWHEEDPPLVRMMRERDEAREALSEWEDAVKHVEADHPDEVHCGCVPVLRKLLNDAQKENEEQARLLGMGGSREARLITERDHYKQALEEISTTIQEYKDSIVQEPAEDFIWAIKAWADKKLKEL